MAEASAVHGTALLSIAPFAAPWSGALANTCKLGRVRASAAAPLNHPVVNDRT